MDGAGGSGPYISELPDPVGPERGIYSKRYKFYRDYFKADMMGLRWLLIRNRYISNEGTFVNDTGKRGRSFSMEFFPRTINSK